jgi:hypothetical protein
VDSGHADRTSTHVSSHFVHIRRSGLSEPPSGGSNISGECVGWLGPKLFASTPQPPTKCTVHTLLPPLCGPQTVLQKGDNQKFVLESWNSKLLITVHKIPFKLDPGRHHGSILAIRARSRILATVEYRCRCQDLCAQGLSETKFCSVGLALPTPSHNASP